jgi:hypothetical protein
LAQGPEGGNPVVTIVTSRVACTEGRPK